MKPFGFVLATKMLMDSGRKVRYMYREAVTNPQDSGWRFFCGDEDDAYVNRPENIAVYDIRSILEQDPTVLPYLNSAPGTAYERENENDDFIPSADFDPEKERD